MEKRSSKETLVSLTEAFPQGAPEDTVRRMASQLADALAVYEKQGVVHQSVKAQNVFVSGEGFRLGEPARSNMPCGGDLGCMCPEMYWGEGFDSRADVYALGLLLHTMLSGGNRLSDLQRLEGEALSRPDCGERLAGIIMRACAYQPKERFATMEDMAKALEGET